MQFLFIFAFSIQLIAKIKIAIDWVRTVDLWCQTRPLNHNHFPTNWILTYEIYRKRCLTFAKWRLRRRRRREKIVSMPVNIIQSDSHIHTQLPDWIGAKSSREIGGKIKRDSSGGKQWQSDIWFYCFLFLVAVAS